MVYDGDGITRLICTLMLADYHTIFTCFF